jgi:hypothetical protein
MYLTPNTGESDKSLHFRGKFLPVPLAREVPFCTFKFLCIFETLPDRKLLFTYLNSASKILLSSPIEVRGTKKKLIFFCPVLYKTSKHYGVAVNAFSSTTYIYAVNLFTIYFFDGCVVNHATPQE